MSVSIGLQTMAALERQMRDSGVNLTLDLGATTDFLKLDQTNGRVELDNAELRLGDADELEFGDAADIKMAWDGTDFDILPAADDSVIKIGNDTLSCDMWLYGDAATAYALWDASASLLSFKGAARVQPPYTVTAKATDATLTAADMCQVFTTRGASGTVTITLPAVASVRAGDWVEIYNCADETLTVDGTDEELLVFNDLTADSISWSTNAEKIGGGFRAVCDGTSWIVVPLGTETQTVTVASA